MTLGQQGALGCFATRGVGVPARLNRADDIPNENHWLQLESGSQTWPQHQVTGCATAAAVEDPNLVLVN